MKISRSTFVRVVFICETFRFELLFFRRKKEVDLLSIHTQSVDLSSIRMKISSIRDAAHSASLFSERDFSIEKKHLKIRTSFSSVVE